MRLKKRSDPDRLAEQLEAQITCGVFLAGARLPSVRTLSTQYGMTEYAVYQGLKKLRDKGLASLKHGSGAYVAEKRDSGAAPSGWRITMFVSSQKPGIGYLSYARTGIQEAAEKYDCCLTVRQRSYYHFRGPEPSLDSQLTDADGAILLGEYDYFPVSLPSRIPAVGLEMAETCGGAISTVSFDPISAAELAVDYFRRKRKKRVEIHYFDRAPLFQWRAECFRVLWRPYGECIVSPHSFGVLKAPSGDPAVGQLFCGGNQCEKYLRAFRRKYRYDMTRDFAVLSMDGKSLVMPDYLPVSTVSINWRSAGEAAFTELLRRLEHPGAEARRILLVPRLHELSEPHRKSSTHSKEDRS